MALLGSQSPQIRSRTTSLLKGSAFYVEEPGKLVGKALTEQDAPACPKKVTLDDLWERVATMMQRQVNNALADMGIFGGTLAAMIGAPCALCRNAIRGGTTQGMGQPATWLALV